MKNINDWVLKYNYFDFTDKEGIRDISHELLRDIIEKCIELEERLEKIETPKASLEPLTIEDLVENSAMVDYSKLKKETKEVLDRINTQVDNDGWVSIESLPQSKIKTKSKPRKETNESNE